MPMAKAQAKSPHDAIFWSSSGQLAVRRGNWKLVKDGFLAERSTAAGNRLTGDDALFLSDLDKDPGESKDLRRENPVLVDELLTLAQKWLDEVQHN